MGYFITSIPKSGTHLLASLVREITGEYPTSVKKSLSENADYEKYARFQNLVGHFRINNIEESRSLKDLFLARRVLVMIRDPRAICNSMLHYLMKSENQRHVEIRKKILGLSFDDQIIQISRGIVSDDRSFKVPELSVACAGFLEIIDRIPSSTLFRYEDFFVGDRNMEKIAVCFGVDTERARVCLNNAISGGSKTKREGTPDSWKSAFSPSLVSYFDENYRDLIAGLGY